MKKGLLLLFVLLTTTALSYSQSTLSNYKTLINALGDGEKNTASELRAVFNAFAPSLYLKGDVKEVDCNATYIALNFDNTGLGINDRAGWAICNGLNGTKDRNGRVGIGYGSAYTTIGATDGSKDAVVVAHSHTVGALGDVSSTKTLRLGTNPDVETQFESLTTSSTGVSGTNKNMQPYIVSLFIQKL